VYVHTGKNKKNKTFNVMWERLMTHSPYDGQSPVMSLNSSVSEQGTNSSEMFNFRTCHSHPNMDQINALIVSILISQTLTLAKSYPLCLYLY
jgi:hypothetical protein